MKVIIVDDERLSRQELKKLLSAYPDVEVIAECANAEEGKKRIEELKPDLVFLDVEMPDKTGFDMLNEISAIPDVVFISAYDEYALKAFEVHALDYLLKPIEPERLSECIKKYQVKEDKENQITYTSPAERLSETSRVFMKDGENCWFVPIKDIYAFESLGNYVKVHLGTSTPIVFNSLNALETRLPSSMFFRANRKFIINLYYIDKISTWVNNGFMLKLSNGMDIDMSRRQSVKFKEVMSL